jgi:hypothetical protein
MIYRASLAVGSLYQLKRRNHRRQGFFKLSQKGAGANPMTINRFELESQMIDALLSKFLQPQMIDLAIEEFSKQLRQETRA